MNSIVLGTGGYALLLSSVLTLVTLIRKQLKHRTSTPFYTMAISDLLYSILTAVLLLVNHVKMIMNNESGNSYTHVSNASMGRVLTNSTGIGTLYQNTVQMNTTDLLMKYAMLMIPLVNTFVSLVTASIQCNLRVLSLKNQCISVIQTEDSAESETSSALNELEGKRSERNKILTFFKSNKPKVNGAKILSIFVIVTQYIMPLIVTGSLYSAQNNLTNATQYEEDSECMYYTNFPLEEFYKDTNVTIESSSATPNSFYITTEDALKLPNMNDSRMDDILSKVQGIVFSTLNSSDSKSPTGFFNKSNLMDITKFMENSNTIANGTNNYETIGMEDSTLEIIEMEEPEERTESYLGETSTMSRDEIYRDILKRIHGTVMSNMIKHQHKTSNRHEKQSDIMQEKLVYNPDILDQILPHIENILHNINTNTQDDQCLLSPKYLKLYLLLVLLLIYCLPISLSSTMQMWGKLSCEFLQEKLDIKRNSVINVLSSKPVAGFCFINESSSSDSSEVQSPDHHFPISVNVPSVSAAMADGKKARCLEMMKQTSNTTRTLRIIKISLVLASVLWFPVLLQIVLKLFLRVQSPGWLMQTTYLLALGSCIARNILNLSIVKLQEVCAQSRKRNSIRPSEQEQSY